MSIDVMKLNDWHTKTTITTTTTTTTLLKKCVDLTCLLI